MNQASLTYIIHTVCKLCAENAKGRSKRKILGWPTPSNRKKKKVKVKDVIKNEHLKFLKNLFVWILSFHKFAADQCLWAYFKGVNRSQWIYILDTD